MLDQEVARAAETREPTARPYDLVVVGAGVAGLNALYAAAEYLPREARVLLIDQKQEAGGMWNTAYDYVRLHQPHPMFTVGNMPWQWNKPRHYLAKRDEVRDHLARSVAAVARSVALETQFDTTVTACEEVSTEAGPRARITFHPNGRPEAATTVEAQRAIYAPGFNYHEAQPLALSSAAVVSIIPQDLRATLAAHPGAPVYVIGGGKTGMDTILAVLEEDPGRQITLINGRGTNFFNRNKNLPTGLKRWTSGELASRIFRDIALEFDGDNEEHTIAHFRKHHATDPNSPNGVFLYGLLSEEENARIAAGLSRKLPEYLRDITDGEAGPVLELQSGATAKVAPGSIVVNCTGSFFRTADLEPSEPVLSPHGCVLRINIRECFHFLTSVSGFFATHLLYRDALRGNGFYTLDLEALFRKNRNAWIGATSAQAYMNQVLAVQTLPMSLLDRCGLDLDRWYPVPRRLAGLFRMKASAKADIAHCRKVLDRMEERFGVHCAAL